MKKLYIFLGALFSVLFLSIFAFQNATKAATGTPFCPTGTLVNTGAGDFCKILTGAVWRNNYNAKIIRSTNYTNNKPNAGLSDTTLSVKTNAGWNDPFALAQKSFFSLENNYNTRPYQIGVQFFHTGSESNAVRDEWVTAYSFVEVTNPAGSEFIFLTVGDDQYRMSIDGNLVLDFAVGNTKPSWGHSRFTPIFLPQGKHLIEFSYENSTDPKSLDGGIIGEIVGPFPPESVLNADKTIKTPAQIKSFIEADGAKNYITETSLQTVSAPKRWVDNIYSNTYDFFRNPNTDPKSTFKNVYSNSIGWYCPADRGVMSFEKDASGEYYDEPKCVTYVPANIGPVGVLTGSTAWTNTGVVVTLTTDKAIQTPAGWTKVSDTQYTKVVESNGEVKVDFVGVSGGTGSASMTVSNIDKVAPVCGAATDWKQSPPAPSNQKPVIFTLSGSSDVPSDFADGQLFTCTASENGQTCTVTLKDKAGNTATCTSPAAVIDTTVPTGTITASTTDWTKGGVTLTLTVSEPLKEAPAGWTVDPTDPLKFTRTVSQNEDISVIVTDTAGNPSQPITYKIANIDKDVPVCGTQWTQSPPAPTNQKPATFTLSGSSDVGSGWASGQIFTCNVSANGETCTVTLKDKAGNTATCTSPAADIDDIPPVLTLTSENNKAYSGTSVTTAFTGSDNVAIVTTECQLDSTSGTWVACGSATGANITASHTSTGLTDGNHTLYVRAKDAAGNESNIIEHKFLIDTKAPSVPKLKITIPDTTDGIHNPTITFGNSTDDGVGVDRYEISIDDGEWKSFSGSESPYTPILPSTNTDGSPKEQHTVRVRAVDKLGHVSGIASSTYPPVVTIIAPTTLSNTGITDTIVEITSSSGDIIKGASFSGASSWECTTSTGVVIPNNWPNPVPVPITCTVKVLDSGTLYVEAANATYSGSASESYIIDTVPPTVTIAIDPTTTLKKGSTAKVTFTLSEDATDFEMSDVTVSGGTLSNWVKINNKEYSATFTPSENFTGSGEISVVAATFHDHVTNPNTVSNTVIVPIDTVPPAFSGSTATVKVVVNSAEATALDPLADIALLDSGTPLTLDKGAACTVSPAYSGSMVGTYTVTCSKDQVTDAAGNHPEDGFTKMIIVEVDTKPLQDAITALQAKIDEAKNSPNPDVYYNIPALEQAIKDAQKLIADLTDDTKKDPDTQVKLDEMEKKIEALSPLKKGTITADMTTPTNKDVTLTLVVEKPLKEAPKGWTKVSDTEYTKVVPKNEEGTVSLTDTDGNTYELPYAVTNIDKVPPVFSGATTYTVRVNSPEATALDPLAGIELWDKVNSTDESKQITFDARTDSHCTVSPAYSASTVGVYTVTCSKDAATDAVGNHPENDFTRTITVLVDEQPLVDSLKDLEDLVSGLTGNPQVMNLDELKKIIQEAKDLLSSLTDENRKDPATQAKLDEMKKKVDDAKVAKDIVPPIFTGEQSVEFTVGDDTPYTNPLYGISGTDEHLASPFDATRTCSVDPVYDATKAGTYTVTCTLTDKHGNTSTFERSITIKSKPQSPTNPTPTQPTAGPGGGGGGGGTPTVTNPVTPSITSTLPTTNTPAPQTPSTNTPDYSNVVNTLSSQNNLTPNGTTPDGQKIFKLENRITDYVCENIVQAYTYPKLVASDNPTSNPFHDDIAALTMFRGMEKDEMNLGQTYEEYKKHGVVLNVDAFEPYRNVTRAEFVKMIVRSLSCRYTYLGTDTGFPDVDQNMWYAEYIKFAVENGWINGYKDGNFRPNAPITRDEAAKILSRSIKLSTNNQTDTSFADVKANSEFIPYIETLKDKGIMKGKTSQTFAPKQHIPRTETSRIIYRTFFGGNN